MFSRLFSQAGLSLDRLRALVEVGAAGSIVKAADADPVKQSQLSRQIKELEDFFQNRLVERHGKGIRLTGPGKELARISRFFLLGLSNFQRGCISTEQTFRIAAPATFQREFLLPALTRPPARDKPRILFAVETAEDDAIERRLHDLTLDFGVVSSSGLSRPLQLTRIGSWRLVLCIPRPGFRTERKATEDLLSGALPLAVPGRELSFGPALAASIRVLDCETFINAATALAGGTFAALLPDYMADVQLGHPLPITALDPNTSEYAYSLVWNPRLLRLNPHAARCRDWLVSHLQRRLQPPAKARSNPVCAQPKSVVKSSSTKRNS